MKRKSVEGFEGKLKIEQWTNAWQPQWPPRHGRFDFADSDGSYALTWRYLNKLSIALKASRTGRQKPGNRQQQKEKRNGEARNEGTNRSWKWVEASRAIKQISNFILFFRFWTTHVWTCLILCQPDSAFICGAPSIRRLLNCHKRFES